MQLITLDWHEYKASHLKSFLHLKIKYIKWKSLLISSFYHLSILKCEYILHLKIHILSQLITYWSPVSRENFSDTTFFKRAVQTDDIHLVILQSLDDTTFFKRAVQTDTYKWLQVPPFNLTVNIGNDIETIIDNSYTPSLYTPLPPGSFLMLTGGAEDTLCIVFHVYTTAVCTFFCRIHFYALHWLSIIVKHNNVLNCSCISFNDIIFWTQNIL